MNSGNPLTIVAIEISLVASQTRLFEEWQSECKTSEDLVRQIATSRGGTSVQSWTTDTELIFAFYSAEEAATAAMEIVSAKGVLKTSSGSNAVKIGIGADVNEKPAVTIARKLKDLARVSQTLASKLVRDSLGANFAKKFSIAPLGLHQVTAKSQLQHVFQLSPGKHADEFLPIVDPPGHDGSSQFFGRTRECFEIIAQLRASRMVSITGPAGIGKSRLANQLARLLQYEYRDGVYVVDFGGTTNPLFVIEAIANVLPFAAMSGIDVKSKVEKAVEGREFLLVLDNCDDIDHGLNDFLSRLIQRSGRLEILATSRGGLHVEGELQYALSGLTCASDQEELGSCEKLFLYRTSVVLPTFPGASTDLHSIRALCNVVRGIPLAIEVAASKLKVLSLKEILEQITEHISPELPSDEVVQEMLRWTYASLPDSERTLFDSLCVFRGSFGLDGLLRVQRSGPTTDAHIRRSLRLLAQKSLVNSVSVLPVLTRYSLSQSLWQFSFERAQEKGIWKEYRERHKEWVLEFISENSPKLRTDDQFRVVEAIDRENANVRAAIEWSLTEGRDIEAAYGLLVGVHMYWYMRNHFSEARSWFEQLLAHSLFVTLEHRAKALNILAVFANAEGDLNSAQRFLDHAKAIAERLGDRPLVGAIASNLGIAYRDSGNLSQAQEAFRESVAIWREVGDEFRLGIALSNLGASILESGSFAEASAVLEESVAVNKQTKNDWALTMVIHNLGEVALHLSKYQEAERHFAASMAQWSDLKDVRGIAMALKSLGILESKKLRSDRAAILLGAADHLRQQVHQKLTPVDLPLVETAVSGIKSQIGETQFEKLWVQGSNMSPEAAVEFALEPRAASIH